MVSFTIFYTNGALSRWDKTPVLWKCEMKSVGLTWHTSRHFRGELTKKKIFLLCWNVKLQCYLVWLKILPRKYERKEYRLVFFATSIFYIIIVKFYIMLGSRRFIIRKSWIRACNAKSIFTNYIKLFKQIIIRPSFSRRNVYFVRTYIPILPSFICREPRGRFPKYSMGLLTLSGSGAIKFHDFLDSL